MNSKQRGAAIALLCFVLIYTIKAQPIINQITNGSFEDTIQCPYFPSQIDFANGWFNATLGGSSDYFNTCSNSFIRRGQFRFSVRALTELRRIEEFASIPVGSAAGRLGGSVRLRDIGTVSLATAEPRTLTRLDGGPGIGLVVYKDAGANTVAVTRDLEVAIAQLAREFPDFSLRLVAAQARFVNDALSNLTKEIVIGGALSLLVILLFLLDWRSALAIGLIVPLSVLVSLTALQLLGVTINVLSLGGLALGVGLLVDNAIVVAEAQRPVAGDRYSPGAGGPRRRRPGHGSADRGAPHDVPGLRADRPRARAGGGAASAIEAGASTAV